MTNTRKQQKQEGFTLIETMVAMAVFLVICGAIFGLLNVSQQRYKTESQVLSSFQDARLALDQIVRDANDSGYPTLGNFSAAVPLPGLGGFAEYTNTPIAWNPGYVAGNPCLIGTAGGGTCTTPGDFDVIFEENTDNTNVKWIRYQLVGTTLKRGVANKTAGLSANAGTSLAGVMVPYVSNVMNNAPAAQIAQYRAAYPAMFPGGTPQPIFQYSCDTNTGPVLCQNAGASNSPVNIRDVEITLIVATLENDAQTRVPRLVELNGRGHRVNPNK
ncbi:MAG TPA: type II secretion system protein [Candidatus Acidoferrales bacterium]|nr:type II secretion system protein [Candidatus Acidoferrales bacterium]